MYCSHVEIHSQGNCQEPSKETGGKDGGGLAQGSGSEDGKKHDIDLRQVC